MALHRVSSMESWDDTSPGARANVDSQLHNAIPRKMSFNPVGTATPRADNLALAAPSETSKFKRTAQTTIACVSCLLAAGTVFGFAALKPVLEAEGVYSYLCNNVDGDGRMEMCVAQEIRLNLMFTTAAVATNISALPVGTILDRFGPRVCGLLGSLFLALGSSFFISERELPFDGYLAGYTSLAIGGSFTCISSFHLSNCFPQHSGLILAMLTGSFDASSSVFLMYRIAYDASNARLGLREFFALYLIVPAFIVFTQVFIMPRNSYKTKGDLLGDTDNQEGPDNCRSNTQDAPISSADSERVQRVATPDERAALLGEAIPGRAQEPEERKWGNSGVWGALHGLPARSQILTPWWVLIAMFTTVQMTRINYFVATIRTQYTFIFDSAAKAKVINDFFDVALPAAGIIAIPFIGIILDRLSTPWSLTVLVSTATAIGILGILSYTWAAFLNVVLFTLYRPLYYTAISDYSAKVFGFQTFGKVYGLIICVAGLFNFVQSGLDTLTHGIFNDDPRPVNSVLLVVGLIIGMCLVVYVQSQKTRMQGGSRDRTA